MDERREEKVIKKRLQKKLYRVQFTFPWCHIQFSIESKYRPEVQSCDVTRCRLLNIADIFKDPNVFIFRMKQLKSPFLHCFSLRWRQKNHSKRRHLFTYQMTRHNIPEDWTYWNISARPSDLANKEQSNKDLLPETRKITLSIYFRTSVCPSLHACIQAFLIYIISDTACTPW